uniref:Uncharacterized protein n=1 Tax=Oryctolagus cuniculus TaxID=9986 RepID=A0A5F9CHC6_RABIT
VCVCVSDWEPYLDGWINVPCALSLGYASDGRKTCLERSSSSFFLLFFFPRLCSGGRLPLPGRLQQQWQQMKTRVRSTSSGSPSRMPRQMVLKMPSWCLTKMVSHMELKKALILSMVPVLASYTHHLGLST